MAIAHICTDCGWDLARIRPQTEPHHSLSIVKCPRCGGVSVRRVHPLWRTWKSLRRVDWSLTVLVVNVVLAVAATVATILSVIAVIVASTAIVANNAGEDIAWFFFTPLAIVAPLVGAWLTAGLCHHHRLKVWLLWMAWTTLLVFGAIVFAMLLTDRLAVDGWDVGAFEIAQVTAAVLGGAMVFWLAGLTIFMLVAALGMPLGWAFLALARTARSRQWRWRRRMRRKALVAA